MQQSVNGIDTTVIGVEPQLNEEMDNKRITVVAENSVADYMKEVKTGQYKAENVNFKRNAKDKSVPNQIRNKTEIVGKEVVDLKSISNYAEKYLSQFLSENYGQNNKVDRIVNTINPNKDDKLVNTIKHSAEEIIRNYLERLPVSVIMNTRSSENDTITVRETNPKNIVIKNETYSDDLETDDKPVSILTSSHDENVSMNRPISDNNVSSMSMNKPTDNNNNNNVSPIPMNKPTDNNNNNNNNNNVSPIPMNKPTDDNNNNVSPIPMNKPTDDNNNNVSPIPMNKPTDDNNNNVSPIPMNKPTDDNNNNVSPIPMNKPTDDNIYIGVEQIYDKVIRAAVDSIKKNVVNNTLRFDTKIINDDNMSHRHKMKVEENLGLKQRKRDNGDKDMNYDATITLFGVDYNEPMNSKMTTKTLLTIDPENIDKFIIKEDIL